MTPDEGPKAYLFVAAADLQVWCRGIGPRRRGGRVGGARAMQANGGELVRDRFLCTHYGAPLAEGLLVDGYAGNHPRANEGLEALRPSA